MKLILYIFVALYIVSVIANVRNFDGLFSKSISEEEYLVSGKAEICNIITGWANVDSIIEFVYQMVYQMFTQMLIIWFFWPQEGVFRKKNETDKRNQVIDRYSISESSHTDLSATSSFMSQQEDHKNEIKYQMLDKLFERENGGITIGVA